MSRRRSAPPDSLELLLDTLCNTFGGVLFIAILVVILLQLSGPEKRNKTSERVTPESIEELARSLETLRKEINVLHKTAQKQELLHNDATTHEITVLRQRLQTARGRRADALTKRDELLLEISHRQINTQRIEAECYEIEKNLSIMRRERDKAKKKVEDERKARSHTVHLPVVHSTSKLSVQAIVQFGRLYIWHRYGPTNQQLGLNTEEFVIVEKTDRGVVTTPRPSSGISLEPGPEFKQAVQRRLSSFSPERYYVQLVVRSDSFREFHLLRDVLAELGYEYSMLPVESGKPVIDRGGRERGVQ